MQPQSHDNILYTNILENMTNPSQAFTVLIGTLCVLEHLQWLMFKPNLWPAEYWTVVNTVSHSEAFASAEHCDIAKALWCVKHQTPVAVH